MESSRSEGITVVIVEDHPMYADSVRIALERSEQFISSLERPSGDESHHLSLAVGEEVEVGSRPRASGARRELRDETLRHAR